MSSGHGARNVLSADVVVYLPRALDAKLDLFKEAHEWEPLDGIAAEGAAISREIHRLKERRHDIIHGMALKTLKEGARRYRRFVHKGRKILRVYRTYTRSDLNKLVQDIADVADRLVVHVDATADRMDKTFGEAVAPA